MFVGRSCASLARLFFRHEVKMASNEFRPSGTDGNSWHPEIGSAVVAPVGSALRTIPPAPRWTTFSTRAGRDPCKRPGPSG